MAQTNILPMSPPARNAGVSFDLDWIEDVRINLSASERRVASLPGRRSVKMRRSQRALVDSGTKGNGLSEADLDVFAKLPE